MPELIRAIAGRLRELVGNRRHAIRHKVRLKAVISLHNAKTPNADGSHKQPPVLEGYTQDLSTTGLALVLPAILIGNHYLTHQEHTLQIELELHANQTLLVRAAAVRYEPLNSETNEKSYLIGMRILDTSDQKRFDDYLQTLSN
jgi:hypothetical protein